MKKVYKCNYKFVVAHILQEQKLSEARLKTCRNLLNEAKHHIELMQILPASLFEDWLKELDIYNAAYEAATEILSDIELERVG